MTSQYPTPPTGLQAGPSGYRREDDDDDLSLADLATPEVVTSRGPSVRTIVVALASAGLGLALLAAGSAWAFGALSHTEAGFCGRVSTPCTSLSLESVATYAEVALPPGTEVREAYYLDWTPNSMVRDGVPAGAGFRAEVRLPAGATSPLQESEYTGITPESPVYFEYESDQIDLDQLSGIQSGAFIDDADSRGPVVRIAYGGTDADGRLVYEFQAGPLQ